MTESITFTIDGKTVQAAADETIWQVANRTGLTIPHLCYAPEPGYRRTAIAAPAWSNRGRALLQASCLRKPTEGMKVHVENERSNASRRMVFELLLADQQARTAAHDPGSKFWQWADRWRSATAASPRVSVRRPTSAIRRWRSIWMRASNVHSACGRAAKFRSTT